MLCKHRVSESLHTHTHTHTHTQSSRNLSELLSWCGRGRSAGLSHAALLQTRGGPSTISSFSESTPDHLSLFTSDHVPHLKSHSSLWAWKHSLQTLRGSCKTLVVPSLTEAADLQRIQRGEVLTAGKKNLHRNSELSCSETHFSAVSLQLRMLKTLIFVSATIDLIPVWLLNAAVTDSQELDTKICPIASKFTIFCVTALEMT